MMSGKMLEDLDFFYNGMMRAQKILDNFSVEFSQKLDSVSSELLCMKNMTNELKCKEDSPAAHFLNLEIASWAEILNECSDIVQKNITGRNFQNRFEKEPLVIVFGIVKAGKSTLGNFLHGREFRDAKFDNPYKNKIPIGKIVVEESGREDISDKESFDENSIESTCSAQYFQIPGLAWVDTPGIGAIQKSSDLRPLEDIAKQYVKYADLVVFLSSSDHPEVVESVFAYQDLYSEGKKLLVAITRSDRYENKPDVKLRKIVKNLVPKSKKDRELQEQSLLNSLKNLSGDIRKIDAVSLSTKLAVKAIEEQSDQCWQDSNMGIFYKKIIDVIADNEILELKKEAPKKLLNTSIAAIVGDEEQEKSLVGLIKCMREILARIEEKFEELSPDGKLVEIVTEDVINQLRGLIRKFVDKQGEMNASKVDLQSLNSEIQQTLAATLRNHIIRIIGEYKNIDISQIKLSGIQSSIQHKTDTHTYTAKVPRSEERDPSGFVENVKAFFGKKYYKLGYTEEERTIDIDLGVDTVSAKKELLEKLQSQVESHCKKELDLLRVAFFGEAKQKLSLLLEKLNNIKNTIENLRYK